MAVTRLHIDQCLTRLQIRRLGLKEHPQSSTESYCHTAQRRATLTAITAEGLGKQVFISVPYPDTGIFIHSAHGSSWKRTSDCEQEQAIPHMDWTTVWALCFTLTEKHVSVTSLLNSRNCVLSMIWCNTMLPFIINQTFNISLIAPFLSRLFHYWIHGCFFIYMHFRPCGLLQ